MEEVFGTIHKYLNPCGWKIRKDDIEVTPTEHIRKEAGLRAFRITSLYC